MSKVRYIKILARAHTLNNTKQPGRIGFGALEERVDSGSNLEADIGEVPHAAQEQAPEQLGGLFSTRGRKLTLLGSALALVLVLFMAVWLFAARASGTNGEPVGTSYPITTTGADITGLGTGPKVGQLAPDFVLNDVSTGQPVK